MLTRRHLLGGIGGAAASATLIPSARAAVESNWSSLASVYRVPDWFRDAKFGIWAHWSAQCVPAFGDWYGRLMYIQGHPAYEHHVKNYGHPADTGFMEIENRWKAENWDPEYLIGLYKKAGAKYFMSLANHHDNLDTYDSKHHAWNTLRVGPRKDIIGTWEKIVRREGLKFGVSNHSSHAWHWWQTAYGYDAEGPRKGQRYDAFKLRKADGAGKWWEGLDPQELYTGPSMVPPEGIDSVAAMNAWTDVHSGRWMEHAPVQNPHHVTKWLLRQKDLVEKYKPDIVYMDGYNLPFGSVGIEAVAHYYEQAIRWSGKTDVVLTSKKLTPFQRKAIVEDIERAYSDSLRPEPWQTCTCIGDWHYSKWRLEAKAYVPAEKVIQRLCDIVSKNGNLLLSVPVRGDGTIDSEEEKVVAGITRWMARYGDAAIFGSRPWRIYGEGPTRTPEGHMAEANTKDFVAEDVRFTVKDGALYAAFLKWPDKPITIAALGSRALPDAVIEGVELVGGPRVKFETGSAGLTLTLPRGEAGDFVPIVWIGGRGIV
jgi:alpha-L-fucosidase